MAQLNSKLGRSLLFILCTALMILFIDQPWIRAQQQTSGGTAVTINGSLPAGSAVIGHVIADTGSTTAVTGNVTAVQSTGSNLHVAVDSAPTTAVTQSGAWTVANGSGVANIGIVRSVASPCTQSTNFTLSTVGVATGAGTSITSTTTCLTKLYANNITNSSVTLRIQDKTGTPIIWVGGAADFSIGPNSNVAFPLEGVTMAGGITAIAGTSSAINLQVSGLQ